MLALRSLPILACALFASACSKTEPLRSLDTPASAASPADGAQTPGAASPFTGLETDDPQALAQRAAALGQHCPDPRTVPSLLARAATLSLTHPDEPFHLFHPIAQTLALCDPENERLFVSWSDTETGKQRAAVRALASLAARKRQLEPNTLVALLRHGTLSETWFALAQLEQLPASVRARAATVGLEALQSGEPSAHWVARALGRTEASVVPALQEVALDERRERSVRVAATVSLARRGRSGQEALVALLAGSPSVVSVTAIRGLEPGTAERHRALLERLARSKEPEPGWPAGSLACAAASRLTPPGPRLDVCGPKDSSGHELAWLDALANTATPWDRAVERVRRLLTHPDPRVVARALEVATILPEFDALARVGLEHPNPGVVGVAAASLRDLARSDPAHAPSHATVLALKRALFAPTNAHAIPTRVALLEATGALGVLSLKQALPAWCDATQRAIRLATHRALLELHAEGCDQEDEPLHPVPNEPGHEGAAPRARLLRFELADRVLTIELSSELPDALYRALERSVLSGAFDGTPLAISPERDAVLLGDPEGDAYPNGREPPLVGRPGGTPFDRLSVAFRQQGADAVGWELVVALQDRPDLDADHTRAGTAEPSWLALDEGLRVQRVRLEP